MILFFNACILLFLIFCNVILTLSVKFNPIKMISSGTKHRTIVSIMKELLLTTNYEALLQILKYPTYDFSEIYQTSVCLFLTVEIVKNIINNFNFDDQIILLSDQCISKAFNLWKDINVEEVALLPVNPMSNCDFSPTSVGPALFEAVMKEALENYSNEKLKKPIDFYSWLSDSKYSARNLFDNHIPSMAIMVPSFMNGYMFHGAYEQHQFWILSLFKKRIDDLINFEKIVTVDNYYWIEVLKVFIALKSIRNTVDHIFYPGDHVESIRCYTNLLIRLCKDFLVIKVDNKFGIRVLNIINNFSLTTTLSEVIQVLFDSGQDFHPDWFINLLMCQLSSETSEDYLNILFYISKRNPHYQTIEIISVLMTEDVFKESKSFFNQDLLLQNPSSYILRPLKRRFIDLRLKFLPFPMFCTNVMISGLLDAPREFQKLLRDIVNNFYEKYDFYTIQMTSIVLTSFTKSGKVRVVDSLAMLYKALNTFLQLPEYYTITSKACSDDGRVELIFNPFLPTKYIQILMNLIIHLALLGGRSPFKIDQEYFKECLKGPSDNLLGKYEDCSSHFEFMFLKISQASKSNNWYALPNHMYHIVENYNEIAMLSDDLVKLTPIPKKGAEWLCKGYMDNSSTLRMAVINVFPLCHFSSLEIYYILFGK
jgi:hypothetical protein